MKTLATLTIGCCLAALSGCDSNGPAMRAGPASLAAAEEFDRRLTWQCDRHLLAAMYKGRLGRKVSRRGVEPTYKTGRWHILPLKKVLPMSRPPVSELLRVSDILFTVTVVPPSPGAERILVNGSELHLAVTQPEAGSRDGASDWSRARALSLLKSCSDEQFDLRAGDDSRDMPQP